MDADRASGYTVGDYMGRGLGPRFKEVPITSIKAFTHRWRSAGLQALQIVDNLLVCLAKLLGTPAGHQQACRIMMKIRGQVPRIPRTNDLDHGKQQHHDDCRHAL